MATIADDQSLLSKFRALYVRRNKLTTVWDFSEGVSGDDYEKVGIEEYEVDVRKIAAVWSGDDTDDTDGELVAFGDDDEVVNALSTGTWISIPSTAEESSDGYERTRDVVKTATELRVLDESESLHSVEGLDTGAEVGHVFFGEAADDSAVVDVHGVRGDAAPIHGLVSTDPVGNGLAFTGYRSRHLKTADGYDYHAIIFPFDYRQRNPWFTTYKQMFVRIELDDEEARAYDLLPAQLHTPGTVTTKYTVSAELQFTPVEGAGAKVGSSEEYTIVTPVVIPIISTWGLLSNKFGWWYHPQEIQEETRISAGIAPGERIAGVVLRTPAGTKSIDGKVYYDFAWRKKSPRWVHGYATADPVEFTWELPESGEVLQSMVRRHDPPIAGE